MRALGKTPNDPLVASMSKFQWRMCIHNVLEDDKETNEKIRNIIDIAVKILVGNPEPKKDGKLSKEGFVGQEPTNDNPDINYTVHGTHGEAIEIHKIMSTEYDRIIASGGKYKGFEVEGVK